MITPATRTRYALTAAVAVLLAACSAAPPGREAAGPSPSRRSESTSSGAAPSATPASTAVTVTAARPAPPAPSSLPLGGTRIVGRYRVVAYYGAPGGGALGVLGSEPPRRIATAIERRARGYRGYGLRVQPAMELIATVAQASPGADGDYSAPIPHRVIRRYLRVAHRDRMLLVLDLQPGRASFLSQARGLGRLLLDPSVEIALDPEWKVRPDQVPGGGLIGSSRARPINAVEDYLSRLVERHALPDKLLVVHEFTASMLPDRHRIRSARGVETLFHADGFGTPVLKRGVYRGLHFPGRPFGAGFKLFFGQDSRLMRPAQVMRLRPRPDMISFE